MIESESHIAPVVFGADSPIADQSPTLISSTSFQGLMVVEYRIRADEDYYVTAYARHRRQIWWYRWLRAVGVLVWIAVAAFIYFSNVDVRADWTPVGLSLFVLVVVLVAALIFSSPLSR